MSLTLDKVMNLGGRRNRSTRIPRRIRSFAAPRLRIDDYLDAQLNARGFTRAPTASRTDLIRRLSFDLLGVPPTPSEIDRFLDDDSVDASDRLIDRYFADPRYGERMARLWLDLVRYADSDGWRQDAYRGGAWKYRQWVADSFNGKMPYDRFVAMQIAGDEIDPANPDAHAAVGFFRLGIYEYNQRNAEGQWRDIVDELTDVTADVFLATGLACAKCHDHKFDPIARSDYYNFRSVFEPLVFVDRRRFEVPDDPKLKSQVDKLRAELAEVEGSAAESLGNSVVDRFPLHVQAMYRKSESQRTSYEHQIAYLVGRQFFEEGATAAKVEKKIGKEKAARRKTILAELEKLGANPYSAVDMLTVQDFSGEIRPTRLPGRAQGRAFEPAAPKLFSELPFETERPIDSPNSTGRRTALAQWITSNDNPITARVIVNRVWQYHFGTGLVDSPNDFGRLGSPPSHPDLLDTLAKKLIDSGWNLQLIQRQIVRSHAYQQATIHPQAAELSKIDPGNRLIWHHKVRRLDAEQYRDALLVAMGSLNSTYGGPSVKGTPARRTIYLRRMRNSADEMLHLMDCPPGVVGTAKRDATITAPQTLMMINNSRILGVSKTIASRVRAQINVESQNDSHDVFVTRVHRSLTGRYPSQDTIELLRGQSDVDICHILVNSNAFLFVE